MATQTASHLAYSGLGLGALLSGLAVVKGTRSDAKDDQKKSKRLSDYRKALQGVRDAGEESKSASLADYVATPGFREAATGVGVGAAVAAAALIGARELRLRAEAERPDYAEKTRDATREHLTALHHGAIEAVPEVKAASDDRSLKSTLIAPSVGLLAALVPASALIGAYMGQSHAAKDIRGKRKSARQKYALSALAHAPIEETGNPTVWGNEVFDMASDPTTKVAAPWLTNPESNPMTAAALNIAAGKKTNPLVQKMRQRVLQGVKGRADNTILGSALGSVGLGGTKGHLLGMVGLGPNFGTGLSKTPLSMTNDAAWHNLHAAYVRPSYGPRGWLQQRLIRGSVNSGVSNATGGLL